MIYGSVCSGVEAATVAWHPLGWKPAFFSEIEKFPRSVLQCRWPEVPLHGDFTTIKENEYGSIDLLVGGTPCQSFSVAGLRKGLADDRGNLALEFIRLAERLKPRWILWENVPGVLSIDGGRAFGSFLGGLAECGYGFAYRILDAQYFGVPQRRRRVFVVGHFGDWRPAAAVLFERESLRGDITPRREAGEGVAGAIGARTCRSVGAQDADCGHLIKSEIAVGGGRAAKCLTGKMQRLDAETEDFILHQGGFFDTVSIQAGALKENPDIGPDGAGFRTDGQSYTLEARAEVQAVCYPINSQIAMRHKALGEGTGMGIGDADDPSLTLLKNHSHAVAIQQNQLGEIRTGECMGTLNTNSNASGRNTPMVMTPPIAWSEELNASADVAGTVQRGGAGGRPEGVMTGTMQVRRLTPIECERLQGFPDVENDVTIYICADEKTENAKCAEISLAHQKQDQKEHVVVHVQIDLERQHLQLHSQGKSFSFVKNAEEKNPYLLHMSAENFVRLIVLMPQILVPKTKDGRAELQQNIKVFSQGLNGKIYAVVSGREIEELVKDAAMFTEKASVFMKSITSEAGQNSLNLDLAWKTWLSCVTTAINSFIPNETKKANSYAISIKATCPYTKITDKTADGPRYKAMGNSMAVPVMSFLGKRIQMVEDIINAP